MVESLSLTEQISRFLDWRTMLKNVLCDRRRATLELAVSSNDSQASLYLCNK